jgi:zinc protease
MIPALTQNVRKTVLANGLTVLTKEVHTAPVATVQVWYRVGSWHEPSGSNGIAHQLEHLMFKGTQTRPIQFGRLFSALGSDSNAFTSYDQTAYFNTVHRDHLYTVLVLEADRMSHILIDEERLTSEKGVVISELQGYENDPGYRLERSVLQAVFPHQPYGLPVGGTQADVERFTSAQVKQYYQTHYTPSNATLVLVGDFDTDTTLGWVETIFCADFQPAVTTVQKNDVHRTTTRPLKEPSTSASIHLQEPGSTPLLHVVYPLPSILHPDVPALQILDLILTEGRNARLEQALVDAGLASQINGYPATMRYAGWYTLWATAAPGQSLLQLEQALLQTLEQLQQQGITTAELQRAKQQLLAAVVLWNRDVTSQAMQLGNDQTTAGDYQFSDRYLQAISALKPDDIQRVAHEYLNAERRTSGFFEPTQLDGETHLIPSGMTQTAENFGPDAAVNPAEVAPYLPHPTTFTPASIPSQPEQITLANGLQILLLSDRSTPTVTLSGYIRAGSEFDTPDTAGLASLTADNLLNGTTTRDALTLAQILDDCGASLEVTANREGVQLAGAAINTDLPVLIDVLADLLQNANFPDDELELSRQQSLTTLLMNLDDPSRSARQVFQQTLYPTTHPFHSFATEASLSAITQADVEQFYHRYYRPDTTILTLVGDFAVTEVLSLLKAGLESWQIPTAARPTRDVPVPPSPTSTRLSKVLPGKSQSITYLGHHGIDRTDPRFYAVALLNQILGGDPLASRLGSEIRDRQGLTYGIYSYFQTGFYLGPFIIEMQTAPEDTEAAIASTLAVLQDVRNQGVTEVEFEIAKQAIVNSYPVDLAHPDTLANAWLMNTAYGLGFSELQNFPNQIQAVTLTQVHQAAQELLHPEHLVIVTVGPRGNVPMS